MPNVENINRLIGMILAAPEEKVRMANYNLAHADQPGNCGTAFCIGGWIGVAIVEDLKKTMEINDYLSFMDMVEDDERAKWLDVDEATLEHIETMYKAEINITLFDGHRGDKRKAAMVQLLTNLRDTGEADWNTALRQVGMI